MYGDILRMPISNPSLFPTGNFGNSEGSPLLIKNSPSLVKYSLSILPR